MRRIRLRNIRVVEARRLWLLAVVFASLCVIVVLVVVQQGYLNDYASDRKWRTAAVVVAVARMQRRIDQWKGRFSVDLPACHLPYVDPDDSVIASDWFRTTRFACEGKRHIFATKVDKTTSRVRRRVCPILLEEVLWQDYDTLPGDLSCVYQDVTAASPTAGATWMNQVRLLNKTPLNLSSCPADVGLIWITCSLQGTTYEQPLYLVQDARSDSNRSSSSSISDRSNLNTTSSSSSSSSSSGSISADNVSSDADEIASSNKTNVLVLGLDALSRVSFHRLMKATARALDDVYGEDAIELQLLNKVGLNSAPNQIPMLTGKRFRHEQHVNDGQFFDDFARFVWEDFAAQGYATMFAEEQHKYGLFTYPSRVGFRAVPTHHWPRPLTIVQERHVSKLYDPKRPASWVCLGGRHVSAPLLDYWLDTQEVSSRPLFSYVWLSVSTHESVTGASEVDDLVAGFFRDAARRGHTERTLIFFLADHGYRMAPYRDTPLGRTEDLLPFGFVLLPSWFRARYPDDVARLRQNAGRLVTPYDIHATLVDFAQQQQMGAAVPVNVGSSFSVTPSISVAPNISVTPRISATPSISVAPSTSVTPSISVTSAAPAAARRINTTAFGISLLGGSVPLGRTCLSASIDPQYCACYDSAVMRKTNLLAYESLAIAMVDSINDLLRDHGASKCSRLRLSNVTGVVEKLERGRPTGSLLVTIVVHPASFIFEATFRKTNDKVIMLDLPDRLDRYAGFSQCADQLFYQKFCHCKQT